MGKAKPTRAHDVSRILVESALALRDKVERLKFSAPVTHVYNPLRYAWEPHENYLRRFATAPRRIVFVGMNPGPFGMTQTGVPFGEISAVRSWLEIQGKVLRPDKEHPKRIVHGFDCQRSEVSGKRLWGLFAQRFGTPQQFFTDHIVLNYCPLVFLESSGRNRTPDKLRPAERRRLFAICNEHLGIAFAALQPEWIVAVGGFAAARIEETLAASERNGTKTCQILHPSPANPSANRDWAAIVTRQLCEAGVWTRQ